MKKHEQLHHHHHHSSPLLRKSPRFSAAAAIVSSSTYPPSRTKPKARPEENAGDAWALSLHVVEPQPLDICPPSDEDDNSPLSHRSSRFTPNKYRTPSPECSRRKPKALTELGLSHLRRSPRFSPPLTLRSGKIVKFEEMGSKERRRRSVDGDLTAALVVKKRKMGSGVWGEIGISNPEILALPEPGSRPLTGKSLRTRTMERINSKKITWKNTENEKCSRSRGIKSAFVKSAEALEKRAARSASGEKCLRSRISIEKKGDRKSFSKTGKCFRSKAVEYPLIEWPHSSYKRQDVSSLRRSPRLLEDSGEISKFETDKPSMEESPVPVEKSLKPRTVKKQVEKQIGGVLKSASDVSCANECLRSQKPKLASDDLLEIKSELGKCDSERMSEKSLRSRKIQVKMNVDGGPKEEESERAVKFDENEKKEKSECHFIGEPIPEEEAQERWGWRYELKRKRKGKSWKINPGQEDEIIVNVDRHYVRAKVGTRVLDIGDCAYVKGEGKKKHIGRILEFFQTTDGEDYFRVQWFYRAEDTVLKDAASSHDPRRVFYSTLANDNMLDCIISKIKIMKIPPALSLKPNSIQSAAFYYDMEYCVEYSTFRTSFTEKSMEKPNLVLSDSKIPDDVVSPTTLEALTNCESPKSEFALLDLYSGCGGMSTGLCIGAKLSNLNLVTKWAVDYNSSACESLKLNHPETQVRNESAEDFLDLLKKWEELCKLHMCSLERTLKCELEDFGEDEDCIAQSDTEADSGEFEVGYLVDICYGDPNETGKRRLHFKVRWKGYGPDEDTWESIDGLSNCQERIQDFVRKGFMSKILPLPGDVDVICGGPPCQGISGYNRYRNFDSPLDDEKNHQVVVFMDIVEFLKPKYVLMENVVDIIRFDKASLARYALSRLVNMKYQARLGTIASGCYGLPQFRLRVFIWGADPNEKLPQFPLPTHDVVVRYWPPIEFERNIVAYDEGQPRTIEEAIILRDSISDLPAVTNNENREEMAYEKPPETEFQSYIRLSRDEIMGHGSTRHSQTKDPVLYDHRPLQLAENDYMRICQIPHRKGANFRDLTGVIVGEDNVARLDPAIERIMLPSGKPLVPDSILAIDQGKSKRPYARVWWDETVSTILTYPHVRAQAILHPEQDRVFTIRECARLQGFPDFYRFCGTIKQRYCQVGNAVSIPVARALGYALGMAHRKLTGDEPLMTLPSKFSTLLPSSDEAFL